jgi:hypothetical protein
VVPRSGCLLLAVEELVESAHQVRVSRVNETGRLRVIYHLGECAMEECVLDVELVDGPTPGDSQSQHSPNGGRLDNGAEDLIIVHPRALGEPPEDPTSLIPIKRDICFEPVFENPLVGDDFGPRRPRNQVPRVVK